MNRLLAVMIGGMVTLSTSAWADPVVSLDPKAGQWSTMIAILDNNQNHYLLKTSVHDDVASCLAQLHNVGEKVRDANGQVFTNFAKNAISFEAVRNDTEIGVKVLEMRCVLEPFKGELVSKF